MKKRIIKIAAFSILGLIVLFLLFGLYASYAVKDLAETNAVEDSLSFETAVWLQENDPYENDRKYMLDDLMNNYLKKGIDSTKVIEILGSPEGRLPGTYTYGLGFYRSPFDPSTLFIGLDSAGKLDTLYIRSI